MSFLVTFHFLLYNIMYKKVGRPFFRFDKTGNYPLLGYILGVLTHTTAWDQHWVGDETLKYGFRIDYT